MTTWYRACGRKIEPVEVIKETACKVTTRVEHPKLRFNDDMSASPAGEWDVSISTHNKRSDYESYFKTREEAKDYLVQRATAALESAKHELIRRRKVLDEVSKL